METAFSNWTLRIKKDKQANKNFCFYCYQFQQNITQHVHRSVVFDIFPFWVKIELIESFNFSSPTDFVIIRLSFSR